MYAVRPLCKPIVKLPFNRSLSRNNSLWSKYSEVLEAHPIPVKVITSGVICGSGDVACQVMSSYVSNTEKQPFDPMRTLRFTFMGSFFIAPILHTWYGKLSQIFPGTSTSSVIKRLLCDQFLFAPTFLVGFMATLTTLEGQPSKIPDRLRTSYVESIVTNWTIWIPAQLLNFKFIPVAKQVLFANVVGFFWNAILSFQASKKMVDSPKPSGL